MPDVIVRVRIDDRTKTGLDKINKSAGQAVGQLVKMKGAAKPFAEVDKAARKSAKGVDQVTVAVRKGVPSVGSLRNEFVQLNKITRDNKTASTGLLKQYRSLYGGVIGQARKGVADLTKEKKRGQQLTKVEEKQLTAYKKLITDVSAKQAQMAKVIKQRTVAERAQLQVSQQSVIASNQQV